MQVNAKYLKDENGKIFSPVVGWDSINLQSEQVKPWEYTTLFQNEDAGNGASVVWTDANKTWLNAHKPFELLLELRIGSKSENFTRVFKPLYNPQINNTYSVTASFSMFAEADKAQLYLYSCQIAYKDTGLDMLNSDNRGCFIAFGTLNYSYNTNNSNMCIVGVYAR